MWRATTMALGLCMVLLGGEAIVVDHVVLANSQTDKQLAADAYGMSSPYAPYDQFAHEEFASFNAGFPTGTPRVFVPPEWAPWGLLSAGALTFLYAMALPGGRSGE